MITQKEQDALVVMLNAGVVRFHINRAFYVRWSRWMEREIANRSYDTGPQYQQLASRVAHASDDKIVNERLGDGFRFRGLDVRLAKKHR